MALAIIFIFVVFATLLGVYAGHHKKMDLENWSVGGRNFGGVLVWVLMAGEIYTTFSFLGASGWAYSKGAPTFYILIYIALAYVLSYFILPPIWRIGKKHQLVTQSDFFATRFNSKWLGVLVAVVGVLFIVPYLQLQLTGLGLIVDIASGGAISQNVAIVIAFVMVALFVFISGIRGTAWVSVLKDIMMIVAMIVVGIGLPYHYFGGIGPMFQKLMAEKPGFLQLPGGTPNLNVLWFMSTSLLTACGFYMWPHYFNAIFTSKSANTFKKNSIVLPIYQLGLVFVFFAGFTALLIVPGLKNGDLSFLTLVAKTYPTWFLGLIGAAGAITAMVPSAVLILTASTLLSKNIVKEAFLPNLSTKGVGTLARWLVLVITFIALVFAIALPSALVNLLLIGYDGVTQFFPGVVLGLLWKRTSKAGVASGIIAGILVTAILVLGKMDPFFGINAGFVALVVNFVVTAVISALVPANVSQTPTINDQPQLNG